MFYVLLREVERKKPHLKADFFLYIVIGVDNHLSKYYEEEL